MMPSRTTEAVTVSRTAPRHRGRPRRRLRFGESVGAPALAELQRRRAERDARAEQRQDDAR